MNNSNNANKPNNSINQNITPVGGSVADDIAKLNAGAEAKIADASNEATAEVAVITDKKEASHDEQVVPKDKKVAKATIARRQARKRIPLGTRNILTAPKRPGFVRRFVNDKGDRIQAFKDAGWAAAEMITEVGDDKAGRATSMGSSAAPSVGGGQRAVLMEIPEKYYDADNKAKQAKIAKVEKEIARNHLGQDGLEGKVSIS